VIKLASTYDLKPNPNPSLVINLASTYDLKPNPNPSLVIKLPYFPSLDNTSSIASNRPCIATSTLANIPALIPALTLTLALALALTLTLTLTGGGDERLSAVVRVHVLGREHRPQVLKARQGRTSAQGGPVLKQRSSSLKERRTMAHAYHKMNKITRRRSTKSTDSEVGWVCIALSRRRPLQR
jgi:hypothetical protein